jgi:hypothetical protein
MKKRIFLCIFLTWNLITNAQNVNPNVDPKWDNFYRGHQIREHFQATDFINVLDAVEFIPKSNRVNKDLNLLKRVLLTLEQDYLRQLMINGWYHSRTYKHDDYFLLYNMTYKKISKDMWDKYCPYLLPIMDFDQTVTGINSQN